MTTRLIDAERLKQAVQAEYCDVLNRECGDDNGYSRDTVFELIDNAPTVELVQHGYWIIRNQKHPTWYSRAFFCSVCDDWQTYGLSSYCPNCGAIMDCEEVLGNGID